MLKRHPAGTSAHRWRKKPVKAMIESRSSQASARPGQPLLEMWLPASAQAVSDARYHALNFCREAGADEEECAALDLALGEALANAVVHGAPVDLAPGVAQIQLCIWRYHDRLIIEIHDHGRGFTPPPPPYQMPPAGAGETHGRGLPLMELLTDALCVCRGDILQGGASIYLVKELERFVAPPDLNAPSDTAR